MICRRRSRRAELLFSRLPGITPSTTSAFSAAARATNFFRATEIIFTKWRSGFRVWRLTTTYYGWQHKQFLGAGEFTLEFGDYLVRITRRTTMSLLRPASCKIPQQVLKPEWIARLKQAETAKEPLKIVTDEEAKANEASKPTGKKTWIFKAETCAILPSPSSRKFIWDAQGHNVEGNKVMAMSFYPNEGNPLWEKYSTQAIIHTLNVYSRYSFDYPYPVAQSINGPVGGMEYPMICFNGPRPQPDGTYSARDKIRLDFGRHSRSRAQLFSDDRQFRRAPVDMDGRRLKYFSAVFSRAGMGEKLSFAARRTAKHCRIYGERKIKCRLWPNPIRCCSSATTPTPNRRPRSIFCAKPCWAENCSISRSRQYSQRWKFKRPAPADFFRTMEDASGTDLDWFWRGWFYTTDHVDISIENVRLFQMNTQNPDTLKKDSATKQANQQPQTLSQQRNEDIAETN